MKVALINSVEEKMLLHVTPKARVTQAARGSDDGNQAQYVIGWIACIHGMIDRAEGYGQPDIP